MRKSIISTVALASLASLTLLYSAGPADAKRMTCEQKAAWAGLQARPMNKMPTPVRFPPRSTPPWACWRVPTTSPTGRWRAKASILDREEGPEENDMILIIYVGIALVLVASSAWFRLG